MSSGSSLTSKLPVYDKIIKMISKSHETIPLINAHVFSEVLMLIPLAESVYRYADFFIFPLAEWPPNFKLFNLLAYHSASAKSPSGLPVHE
jgi:hypothetical protein